MTTSRVTARRILVDAIKRDIFPEILRRGFVQLVRPNEPDRVWHFHRATGGGGYDVITVALAGSRLPEVDIAINYIEPCGVEQPWAVRVSAASATAFTPLSRILIRRKARGFLALLLPRWFAYDCFGFKLGDGDFPAAAKRTCADIVACLGQADSWWAKRLIGENLVTHSVGFSRRRGDCSGAGACRPNG